MANAKLGESMTVKITPKEDGITTTDFCKLLGNLSKVLKSVDESITGQKGGKLDWMLTKANTDAEGVLEFTVTAMDKKKRNGKAAVA